MPLPSACTRHILLQVAPPSLQLFTSAPPAALQHSPGKGDRVKPHARSSMQATVVLHHVQHTVLAPVDLKSQQAVLPPLPFARDHRWGLVQGHMRAVQRVLDP